VVKHVVIPAIGALILLIPLVGQFYPAPAGVLKWLVYISVAWMVLGALLIPRARRSMISSRSLQHSPELEAPPKRQVTGE